MSPDIAAGGEPIYQFDGAVMSNLKPLGQISDPRTRLWGHPFQGKHKLVLVRFDTRLARRLLTEVQETADLIAQFRQGFVLGGGELPFHTAKYIVSRPLWRPV